MENIENALIAGLRAMLKVLEAPRPPKGEDGHPESNPQGYEESSEGTETTEVTNSPEGPNIPDGRPLGGSGGLTQEATVRQASAGFRRFRF